jgi:hypothetical protein
LPDDIRQFDSGAVRSNDVDHLRFDLIPPVPLRRLAARYGMGAEKYGDHNYLSGIPYSNILNHVENHINKLKVKLAKGITVAEDDDDDLAAIAWGAFAIMQFDAMGRRQELNDLTPLNGPTGPTFHELFPNDKEPEVVA